MKLKQYNTPILLIFYNRPDCSGRVLSVLQHVRPGHIYVACDGWKGAGDRIRCEQTRALIQTVSWKCTIHTLFHTKNLGSRKAPYEAMRWFFRHETKGIILEDDTIPNISFFRYCEELLRKYESDPTVGCISGGNVIASDISLPSSYYFSRYSQTWGWATWQRVWKLYDIGMRQWPEMKKRKMLEALFRNPWTRMYWKLIFDAVYEGRITSAWDYQWTFMSWSHRLLSVLPGVNMVRNIGIGNADATHTKHTNWIRYVPVVSMKFPLQHPTEKTVNTKIDAMLQKRMYVLWKEIAMGIYRRIRTAA